MFGRNVLLNMLLRALFIHILDLRFTIYDLRFRFDFVEGCRPLRGLIRRIVLFPTASPWAITCHPLRGFRLCSFGIAVRFVSGGYATRPYMGVCAVVVSGDHICFVTVAPTCQSLGHTLFIYVGILNGAYSGVLDIL